MKRKFVFILLIIVCLPMLFSCGYTQQEKNNISQIRYNVFYGEQNGVCVKAFSEEKEYPFINDGIACGRENFVIVKVLNEFNPTKITLSFNGQTYTNQGEYNANTNSIDYSFKVKRLPDKEIVVETETNSTKTQLICKSMLKSDTISPLIALEKVNKEQSDFVSSLYENGEFKAEIYIRLIVENDYNFYYVGYAQGSNKITAFLIDGVSGEILAGKS